MTDEAAALLEPVAALEELVSLRARDRSGAGAAPAQARAVRAPLRGLRSGRRAGPGDSIPVTSARRRGGQGIVGMHFFNPPPLMRLLEVIRAAQTGERAFELARRAFSRAIWQARDFGRRQAELPRQSLRPAVRMEALQLLEVVLDHEQVDRIHRLGGGFPRRPFELMDLVGIDVGLEVAQSFSALSFGEPRRSRARSRLRWWPRAA